MYYKQTKSMSYHPNRLVKKHDEYLTNKYLANKIIKAKPTI